MTINTETIKKDFLRLSAIDSISFGERDMADALTKELQDLGFTVHEDDAAQKLDGTAGNIYGFLGGTLPGNPILLSAHMDTVQPGIGKKAIVEGDKITSDGTTVLGADDLAGVIPILRGVQMAIESGEPMRDVEVLFTVAEEVYVKGARQFDYSKVRAKDVYVLDMSGELGRAAVKAPSIVQFKGTVKGRAAHAGFEPENGLHAIEAMAKAVAKITNGHIDDESTFNIGKIGGGQGTNIVPESCTVEGEARSFNHSKAMEHVNNAGQIIKQTAEDMGLEADFQVNVCTEAFATEDDTTVVRRHREACEKAGLESQLVKTFGGSDNNWYAKQGLSGVVMAIGGGNVHSTAEYCYISKMMTNCQLVSEIVKSSI